MVKDQRVRRDWGLSRIKHELYSVININKVEIVRISKKQLPFRLHPFFTKKPNPHRGFTWRGRLSFLAPRYSFDISCQSAHPCLAPMPISPPQRMSYASTQSLSLVGASILSFLAPRPFPSLSETGMPKGVE